MSEKKLKIQQFTLYYDHSKPIVFRHLSLKDIKIIDSPLELNYFNVVLKAFTSNKLEKDTYPIAAALSVTREKHDDKELLALLYQGDKLLMNKIKVMELQSIIEKFLSRIDIFDTIDPIRR